MKLVNLYEAFVLKLRFNLQAESSKYYLNYAWWVLEPALFVAVFYLVFEILLRRGGEDFMVFLLLGKVPFQWFSRSISNAAGSILNGRGLIQQMAIPKPFFPLLVVAQDAVKQTIVFALLLIIISSLGFPPGITWLAVPVLLLAQILLIASIALITAAIVPYLPDFRFIVQTGMILLMFGSGLFYDYRQVLLDKHKELFLLNPLARLIDGYRDALMRDAWPDWSGILIVILLCGALIALMLAYFRRNDATYARLVIQ